MSGDGSYRNSVRANVQFMGSADGSRQPSPPSVVAETIVKSVTSPGPKSRYETGGGARIVLFLRRVLSDRAFGSMMLIRVHLAKPSK